MDFFSKCSNQDEAKALFRKLSKNFHPDAGGDSALMIELKKQYDEWKPKSTYFDFGKWTRLPDEEIVHYTHSSFMNPRVEVLENELRRLKAQMGSAPNTIQRLKEQNNRLYLRMIDLEDEICASKSEIKEGKKKFDDLKEDYETLLKEKECLQKVAISKEETADTLWDKIKFVMGCNPKKSYK